MRQTNTLGETARSAVRLLVVATLRNPRNNEGMSITSCPTCETKNRVPESSTGVPQCGKCKSKLPWLVNATDATFDSIADTKLPVLVDLWAPWCGPCRMVAPILEKIAKKYAGQLKIAKVNVDENRQLQSRFQAMSIPTMLLLRGGNVVARQVGAMQQPQLEAWLAQQGVKP